MNLKHLPRKSRLVHLVAQRPFNCLLQALHRFNVLKVGQIILITNALSLKYYIRIRRIINKPGTRGKALDGKQ